MANTVPQFESEEEYIDYMKYGPGADKKISEADLKTQLIRLKQKVKNQRKELKSLNKAVVYYKWLAERNWRFFLESRWTNK